MGPASRRPNGPGLNLGGLPPAIPTQSNSRPDSATSSPVEPPQERNSRFAGAFANMAGSNSRLGASSPSHEQQDGRYFPRSSRAREIRQSEAHGGWGPPVASGLSTPLRETIPESPNDDSFPDFNPSSLEVPPLSRHSSLGGRRTRAGTTPSRFPGVSEPPSYSGTQARTTLSSRATPSGSPHRPETLTAADATADRERLRAGSTPSRSNIGLSPFISSSLASIWSGPNDPLRTRSNTGGSFHSEGSGGRAGDSLYETDVKTLGLMGLDSNGNVQRDPEAGRFAGSRRPMSSDVNRFSTSRFRSYSTNNKEKYAMEEEAAAGRSPYGSGTLTPAAKATAAQLAANNAELARHNAQVQAYIQGSNPSNRPRARTAGLLDSSSPRYWRSSSITSNRPQQFEQPLSGFDWSTDETLDYEVLKNAVTAMQLQSGNTDQDASTRGEQSRAIWLGGVPPSITPSTLKRYFEGFGSVESTRVMTQKGYGFVNFEHVSSATVAKTTWDGQEIFPGFGSTRIAFAKDPSNTGTPGMQDGAVQNGASAGGYPEYGQAASIAPGQFTSARFSSDPGSLPSDLPQLSDIRAELLSISRDFCASSDDELDISGMIDQADQFGHYAPDIPPVAEPSHIRIHDAPRLRDIRKRIDNGSCSSQDIEDIARGMLPEVAELASDYLGNTVVQKLFEYCSQPMKEAMLRKVVPQLAQIGTHKNGTWAAQTIIRTANTPQEQEMIITGLRPYGRASFLDQYGNYVMQGCLRFGSPYNNFLFEIMLGQLWPMAEARFGARAMRACLESQEATKNHQRMLAAAIALYSDHLAINSNGALLLTWYLDTCAFKNRRKVLVPRLIPHMIQLCTHKVAYMTILKLINQKEEPEAREKILRALFFSQGDETLEAVIKDQSCGATFVFKTLTTPFFDDHLRTEALENVRNVLTRIKAPPNQSYKRLMDEVGLTRGTAAEPRMNGASPKRSRSGQHSMNGNTYPSMNIPQMFTPGSMNGGCPPPAKYESFGANGMAGSPYANNQMPSPMAPGQNQQYHQSSPYAQGRYNYGGPPPMGSNGYPTPMSGYGPQSQGRSPQPNYNPGAGSMMPQQGYNPALMAASPGTQWQQQYGPPPSYGMPPQQQMHPPGMMGNGGGGRRGRR